MENKRNTIIGGLILVLLIGGFALWKGGFIGEDRTPSLDRSVEFPADFPEAGKEIWNKNVTALKDRIKADPTDSSAWLDLAIYWRMVGDYEGAALIWQYLEKKTPQDPVPLHNLGNYYHLGKKDYKKAEDYYRRAIEANPSVAISYTSLHELYRYSYKQDTSSAVDVLLEGLDKVQDGSRIDLSMQLGSYFASKNDSQNALKYYTLARDAALELKNRDLAARIESEMSKLPR